MVMHHGLSDPSRSQQRRAERQAKQRERAARRAVFLLRKRARLDKLPSFLLKKGVEQALERPLNRLFVDFLGQLAAAVLVAVGLVVLQFVVHRADASPATVSVLLGAMSAATIAGIAGGGAGGAAGAVIGAVWGLLAGEIADTSVAQLTSDPIKQRIGEVAGWCLATLLGWLMGKLVERVYRIAFERSGSPIRVGGYLLVLTAILTAAGIVLWKAHVHISLAMVNVARSVVSNGSAAVHLDLFVLAVAWLGVVVWFVSALRAWIVSVSAPLAPNGTIGLPQAPSPWEWLRERLWLVWLGVSLSAAALGATVSLLPRMRAPWDKTASAALAGLVLPTVILCAMLIWALPNWLWDLIRNWYWGHTIRIQRREGGGAVAHVAQLSSEEWDRIHALERLLLDARENRDGIIKMFCAIVREQSPWPPIKPGQWDAQTPLTELPRLRVRAPEVQAILIVLGRNSPGTTWSSVDICNTDLRCADIPRAHFEYAALSGVHLEGANLNEAQLPGANLAMAHLEKTMMVGAQLDSVNLEGAHLEAANLSRADLRNARLTGAHMEGTNLAQAWANNRTIWPEEFDWRAASVILGA
jgi:Pentapeptide repeats (8 copies)